MERSPTLERMLNEYRNKGREIGFRLGKEECTFDITRKMLKANISIDIIMEVTGLSKNEIESLE